jgi:hypothetical protein
MAIQSFIDPDPNNPPECKTCNDYGGVLDDELTDPEGLPVMYTCPICSNWDND